MAVTSRRTVGSRVHKSEAALAVSGSLRFAGDVQIPGVLHGKILRSPHAHARIRSINVTRAARMRGVVAVLTGADLAAGDIEPFYGPVLPDRPLVAIDRVRFSGEPVAAVIAEDVETAVEAVDRIEVEYEPLPAALTPEEAAAPDAPIIHEAVPERDFKTFPDLVLHPGEGRNVCNYFRLRKGDAAAAFAEPGVTIFEDVYRTPAQQHGTLEPHVTVAQIEHGAVTLWTSSAGPFTVRSQIAETLRVPAADVRVIVLNVGGAYGAKTYPRLEPLVAAMSWRVGGRPVRVELSHTEEFYTITRHSSAVFLRSAVRPDGRIVGREVRILWGAGAYADISPRLIKNGGYSSAGPYRIDNVSIDSYAMYTNTTPAGGFRGYGVPQVAWAYESQMDSIAARLGIDPLELRLRNLVHDGDTFATGQVMEDLHLDEMVRATADRIGWSERKPDPVPHALSGRTARGRGLACIVKTTVTPSTSTASLKLNDDGSLNVLVSTVEVGQGARTVLRQIAADAVGVPYEHVAVSYPDTAMTPWDQTTSSSRSTLMMGGAIREAGACIRSELVDLAAEQLEASAADLEIEAGEVRVKGSPGTGKRIGEVIRSARAGNLLASATNRSAGSLDPETGQGTVTPHFYHAAVGAEVEVDLETGRVRILELASQTWSGQTVNPVLAELQVEGNMAFGIGQALLEEIVVDDGQIVNASLADYMLPSILDLGDSWHAEVVEEGETGRIHGLGESTAAAVPGAIGNAVANAIGVRIHELPLHPERVLRELDRARAEGEKATTDAGSDPHSTPVVVAHR
jgi:CO/xanthine dehydrogenase Mo-binding subunit